MEVCYVAQEGRSVIMIRNRDQGHCSAPSGRHPAVVGAPIFVVGAARAGTTLLQSMIDSHPEVALVGELHFFDQIMRLSAVIPEPFGEAAFDQLRAGVLKCHSSQFVPDLVPALDLALRRLPAEARPTYGLLFAHLLKAFAELRGVPRVGEKTPTNIRYLPELVTVFPDAHIVHILRDPRDSISSRIRYPFSSPSVIFNTLLWKIEMIYAHDFAAEPTTGSTRYLEVRYEHLVVDPTAVLSRICDFIGVSFSAAMLAGHQRVDQVVKDEAWKQGVARPINAASVGAWRQRLTPAQAGLLEIVAGDYLEQTGYSPQATVGRAQMLLEAIRDLLRFLPYKLRERWQARRSGPGNDMIGSESSKVSAMLRRALR